MTEQTSKVESIFRAKRDEITQFVKQWKLVHTEMCDIFKQDAKIVQQLDVFNKSIHEKLASVVYNLNNPTITIATTGTTSSGKSTLVNMLCGAEIMPVATQEMSAGIVTVTHSTDKRVLRIDKEKRGVPWLCGEWTNLSDSEIRSYLTKAMEKYNELKDDDTAVTPPPPLSELEFPIRIFESLNLPVNFKFEILDLPGLNKVMGDDTNMEIIQKKARKALCLITYNSEETDREKQNKLLREIVEQVQDLGGTPNRMLFIFNRIDAFLTDPDPKKSEDDFVIRTTEKIRKALSNALPLHEKSIKSLQTSKLSSLPALLALIIRQCRDKNKKIALVQKLIQTFGLLVSGKTIGKLYQHGFKERHILLAISDVLENSHGKAFDERLRKHITDNIPELVIPQIVDEFRDIKVDEGHGNQLFISWILSTIRATMKSSKDDYEKEKIRLASLEKKLDAMRKQMESMLLKPFQKISKVLQNPNITNSLTDVDNVLSRYKGISKELKSIFAWRVNLAKTINELL